MTGSKVTAAGGKGTIVVATERECQWTLKADADWLKFESPTSGQGPAEVSFLVAPNRSTSARSIEVVASEQRAVISQEPATCTYTVSPLELVIGSSGGDRTVKLTTEDFCSWEASSSRSWITIASGNAGKGNAELVLRIARNERDERTAIVEVPGGPVAVRQREGTAALPPVPPTTPPPSEPPAPAPPSVPCTYDVAPTTISDVASTATVVNVDVMSQSGCEWTAASRAAWIVVSSGTPGTGSGRVALAVQENSGLARSGEVVVAGRTVMLSQRSGCSSFTIAPGSFDAPAAGGTIDVTITTGSGCAWSVTDTRPWASASPASGAGTGKTTVTVQANTADARTATLKIAGRNFVISQQAAPCSYTINPTAISVSSAKRTRKIAVTTQAHCPVTATVSSGTAWIHLLSAPFSGSGDVEIAIDENKTDSQRTGSVTITGTGFTRTVVVTQDNN